MLNNLDTRYKKNRNPKNFCMGNSKNFFKWKRVRRHLDSVTYYTINKSQLLKSSQLPAKIF